MARCLIRKYMMCRYIHYDPNSVLVYTVYKSVIRCILATTAAEKLTLRHFRPTNPNNILNNT